MREKILNDIMVSMKNKDKDRLSVLRMVKGSMQLEEINKKRELDDQEVIAVLAKQIKTRKESIEEFKKGNRKDLVDKTEAEIGILQEYMPEQLSEEEIMEIIEKTILEVNPQSPADLGKIMKVLTPQLTGKADMSFVSKKVKELMVK